MTYVDIERLSDTELNEFISRSRCNGERGCTPRYLIQEIEDTGCYRCFLEDSAEINEYTKTHQHRIKGEAINYSFDIYWYGPIQSSSYDVMVIEPTEAKFGWQGKK